MCSCEPIRYWCKIAIPILWQDPFSLEENYSIILKYISSLSEETLNESWLNEKISKPLFDYAKFLKVLDQDRFERLCQNTLRKISALEFNGFEFKFAEAEYTQLQLFHALIYIIKSQKQLRLFSIVIEDILLQNITA
ncbi:hypothetical protein C2G38_2170420 [Gigaspora rosea]|uniref:Uncharacterized protein n=1 Tax=Gigaspora rosea TaxID=44941 RepID=A0A397VUR4_9GLOM|nr:hypothetical protein C2G38_2170420 [Gigaspora rosea]